MWRKKSTARAGCSGWSQSLGADVPLALVVDKLVEHYGVFLNESTGPGAWKSSPRRTFQAMAPKQPLDLAHRNAQFTAPPQPAPIPPLAASKPRPTASLPSDSSTRPCPPPQPPRTFANGTFLFGLTREKRAKGRQTRLKLRHMQKVVARAEMGFAPRSVGVSQTKTPYR
jgi:hypothetical protein